MCHWPQQYMPKINQVTPHTIFRMTPKLDVDMPGLVNEPKHKYLISLLSGSLAFSQIKTQHSHKEGNSSTGSQEYVSPEDWKWIPSVTSHHPEQGLYLSKYWRGPSFCVSISSNKNKLFFSEKPQGKSDLGLNDCVPECGNWFNMPQLFCGNVYW